MPFSLLPLPSTSPGKWQTTTGIGSIAIAAKSKHQKEAWQVIEYLAGDAAAMRLSSQGRMPAKLTAATLEAWAKANWPDASKMPTGLEHLKNASLILMPGRKYGAWEDKARIAMQKQMEAVLAGTVDIYQSMDMFERLRQEALAQ